MYHFVLQGFFGLLLMICLAGLCIAEDSPSQVLFIQGGVTSITNGSEGMSVITVSEIDPNVTVTTGDQIKQISVGKLTNMNYPLHAAVIFTHADDESASLVSVSNLSLSGENKTLTLEVAPVPYYEGEVLSSFVEDQVELSPDITAVQKTQIYIEIPLWPEPNLNCPEGQKVCCGVCISKGLNCGCNF